MKIVIDIDENVFTRLFDNGIEDYEIVNDDLFKIAKSIRNCIPLPKGHGRLIDVSEYYDGSFNDAREFLDNATTIIEADKAESEDKE